MRFALLVGVLLLLAACGFGAGAQPVPTPVNPYVPLRDLQADPAASLRLPGADQLGGGGEEREYPGPSGVPGRPR